MINSQTRTEVVPEIIFLGRLLEQVAAGKIRIPKFQRPFVWKQQDVHGLLDSVYKGFPIGSILVWETGMDIESASRVGPVEIEPPPSGNVMYLLDGQQRISALVGTLLLQDDSQPILNGVDWRVYFDLESSDSRFLRVPSSGPLPQHFPLSSLLDTFRFLTAAGKIPDPVTKNQHWLEVADHLANSFRDYQLPIIRIRGADTDDAVTVFARLNRTGRKMSLDQMVSVLTYRKGDFHLAENIDRFEDELLSRGFGNFNRIFLVRSVLAALDLDIYAKDWAGDLVVRPNVRSRLPGSFKSATKGITGALQFLNGLGVTSDRLLPYGLQLVLLGEFYRLCPDPKDKVVSLLERWFWVTSFSGWFGTASTSRVTQALHEIRKIARNEITSLNVVDLNEQALQFPNHFDGKSARVRAFLLYLSSLEPFSIKDGRGKLNPGQLLSNLGPKAMKYVCYNPAVEEFSSTPANRLFLDDDVLGNAFDHFRNLKDEYLRELLPSHGFPVNALQKLRDDDKREFIHMREKNLILGEREFMEEKHVKLPEVGTGETIADSDASD